MWIICSERRCTRQRGLRELEETSVGDEDGAGMVRSESQVC